MLEGDRLTLTCVIEAGKPKPEVSWYKDKILLLVDGESMNFTLEELKDTDEGRYKCEARNRGGVADASMDICVDGKSRKALASFALEHL